MTTKQIANFDFEELAKETGQINGPISLSVMPEFKIDFSGMIKYAHTKGVTIPQLSDKEKKRFVR